jgi:hypothetical protein
MVIKAIVKLLAIQSRSVVIIGKHLPVISQFCNVSGIRLGSILLRVNWCPPGPENPLGARWIGFWTDGNNAIGFHGTPHEHLIGQAVSHGCVRMRNTDVIELYERIRVGAQVIVQP